MDKAVIKRSLPVLLTVLVLILLAWLKMGSTRAELAGEEVR
jgi:hypothetical protein